MRLYWACTHTTLRNTEVPLLIDRGIEVIPEEANIDIVVAADAINYDRNEAFDRKWRAGCTVPAEYLDPVRRARLLQRRGMVSAAEQAMFNALFDVIYIPSFLDIAVNVKSWFSGEVIFRYFGAFANLQSLNDQSAGLDPALVAQLYFLPIFSTLCEEPSTRRFGRYSILHPVIDPADGPPPWGGVRPDQSAVVLLYPLFEGGAMVERARALIPLARRIPLTILGQNDPAQVPEDIKRHFTVNGSPDRATHFQRMSDARLLIYPYSSSQHMHYVPLEAVSAGIPLLCHASIPLLREYEAAGGRVRDIPGILYSSDELLERAEIMFNDIDGLPDIAARQAVLPICFQRDKVAAEVDELVANLRTARRHPLPPVTTLPQLGRLPTARGIETRREFARSNVTVPVADLVRDVANALLGCSGRSAPFDACLMASQALPQRLTLGCFEDQRFIADHWHEVAIDASVDDDAALLVTAELWSDGSIVETIRGVEHERPAGGRADLRVRFAMATPASLVLTLSIVGSGRARFISATHCAGTPAPDQLELAGGLCGTHDLARRLRQRGGVPVALLGDPNVIALSSSKACPLALMVGPKRIMISLHPYGVGLRAGNSLFRFRGSCVPGAVLEVVAECWSAACEMQSIHCFTIEDGGAFDLDVPLSAPSEQATSPVFYFRSIGGEPIELTSIALFDPARSRT